MFDRPNWIPPSRGDDGASAGGGAVRALSEPCTLNPEPSSRSRSLLSLSPLPYAERPPVGGRYSCQSGDQSPADDDWLLALRRAAPRASPPFRPIADMCSRSRLTAWPPFRPACRASSGENSCAVPCACAARPPLLAISRCLEESIAANPRLLRPSLLLGICGTPFHGGCSGPTGRPPAGRSEETSEPERRGNCDRRSQHACNAQATTI